MKDVELLSKLNRDIAGVAFDFIKKAGFEPYDKVYGDTYFIFIGLPNSVIHFRVKGLSKHWKFGMWVNSENLFDGEDDDPIIRLFCQYDTQIDKFKPSRSSLLVEANKSQFNDWLGNPDSWFEFESDLKSMLSFIKRHFIAAYSGWEVEYWTATSTNFKNLKNFMIFETYEMKTDLLKRLYSNLFVKYAEKKIKQFNKLEIVENAELFDSNIDGWECNPRYEVAVKFKGGITDEEMNDCINKVVKKDRFGYYSKYEYTLEMSYYKDGVRYG